MTPAADMATCAASDVVAETQRRLGRYGAPAMTLHCSRWFFCFVVVTAALAPLSLGGCAPPCTLSSDCDDTQFCMIDEAAAATDDVQGVCGRECESFQDCVLGETCTSRGRCVPSSNALILSMPDEVAHLAETPGSITARVSFLGAAATVSIEVVSTESNASLCVPFDPVQQTLLGSDVAHTEHDVTLAVPPYGNAVMQLVVDAGENVVVSQAFSLRGPAPEAVEGLTLGLGPVGLTVDANATAVQPGQVTASVAHSGLWGNTEPENGAPTPLLFIGDGAGPYNVLFPLLRGPQTVWLEDGATGERCGRRVHTLPTDLPDQLEVAQYFAATEEGALADVNLELVLDLDDRGAVRCDADSLRDPCSASFPPTHLKDDGHERLAAHLADGVYGVVVTPGIVGGTVSSMVRLSFGDNHLGFFGPRTLDTEQLQSWRVARIYVVGGSVSVEPIDEVTADVPDDVSTW